MNKVYILKIRTADSFSVTITYCCKSRKVASRKLLAFVTKNWKENDLESSIPKDSEEAIKVFFEHTDNIYEIKVHKITK